MANTMYAQFMSLIGTKDLAQALGLRNPLKLGLQGASTVLLVLGISKEEWNNCCTQLMIPLLCPASSSEISFPGISWQENIILFVLCVSDGTGGEKRMKSLLRLNCFLARGAL